MNEENASIVEILSKLKFTADIADIYGCMRKAGRYMPFNRHTQHLKINKLL